MQTSGQINDFFDPEELRSLTEMRVDQEPLFSLFLDLRPNRPGGSVTDRFERLLNEAAGQKKLDREQPEFRRHWDQEAEYIRQFLSRGLPQEGQGLVIYSSQAAGVWQAYLLPLPFSDHLVAGPTPFTRPLEILLGEYRCTLLALVDEASARLVRYFLGSVKEVDEVQAVPVTGDDRQESLSRHAGAVMETVEAAWQAQDCAQVVVGAANEETLNALHDRLPGHLLQYVAAEILIDPRAGEDDIRSRLNEISGDLEERLESQHIQELVSSMSNGGSAVVGLDQSVLAVRSKKVRLLLVEEDFHLPGGDCPNCGFLEDGEEENCLLCGVALRPEADIIEAALKRVLDNGGEIDVLRSGASRGALEPYGKIAALVDVQDMPPEKTLSGRRTMAEDGEIDRDAIHDEAMEESFPASDPPSWSG